VRGIFCAAVLARLEEDTGTPLVDHFDLVVGTSTGGIIALALGAGLTPRQVLDFYVSERGAIFGGGHGWAAVRRMFRAKYRPDGLEAALKRVLGDKLLGESRVPLVVPSYNLRENAVHLFKTPHHPRLRRDHLVPMWAVGMATSAAPTFFPAFRLPADELRLIDGGVWANNPAMVGTTEAVSTFGFGLDEIRVLSVGTTTSLKPRSSRLDNAGLARWARGPGVVEVLMAGQSAGAFAQVQHLIGAENAYRLNPPAPPELAQFDTCDAGELIGKASHHSRLFAPTYEAVFTTHVASPLRPFHGLTPKGRFDAHS
jgi:predicted acylesterase/phospholipase RssA